MVLTTPSAVNATRRLTLLLGALLAVFTAWNAHAVIGFDFVPWDDDINIYFNPHLGPPSAPSLEWMFTDLSYMRRYVPLGWLSLSSIYAVSGLSPLGYHAANLALHVTNTLLLFSLLLRLLMHWGARHEARTIACAALGAGLWALHPFRAETIGWASGVFYGSAGTLALLAMHSYLRVITTDGARSRLWLVATALAYLGSLLAYPLGLGLLGIFVLLDVAEALRPHPAPRPFRRVVREKLLLALPCLLVLTLTVTASTSARAFWGKPPSLDEFGWLPRAAQAVYSWSNYLWRRWWPVDLTPAPTRLLDFTPTEPIFWLSGLALTVITIALFARHQWRRGPLLWWLAFLCLLAPLLGFMERPYFPCDRYDYFAGMVVSAAIAFALHRLSPRLLFPVVAAALVGLLALAWAQRQQLQIWQNADTLNSRLIATSDHLGFRVKQYEAWINHHARRGDHARAAAILAECERLCGPGPWLDDLRRILAAPAASAAALHTRLALDFSRGGRRTEAREHLRAALHLDASFAPAAYNYAVLRALDGEPLEALHWYFNGVARTPSELPPAARRRGLSLIAESFAANDRPKLASHALGLALREPGPPDETAALQNRLQYLSARTKL